MAEDAVMTDEQVSDASTSGRRPSSGPRRAGPLARLDAMRPNLGFRPRPAGPHDIRARSVGMAEVTGALEEAWRRFVELVQSLDPADGDRPVPTLDWTVAETVAHVATVLARGTDPRRAETVAELAALNQRCVDELPERDLGRLAHTLQGSLAEARATYPVLRALWRLRVGRWITFRLHVGIVADLPTAFSYALMDFLVHGHDVATATGRPWVIDPAHASIGVRAVLPATAPWLTDEARNGPRQQLTFAFSDGHALAVTVGEGRFTVRPIAAARAEATVDPVEAALALAGRTDGVHPVVARLGSLYGAI